MLIVIRSNSDIARQKLTVEYLEEDIQDLRMRLLHFIEQHNVVRAATNCFTQLTSLVITWLSQ